MKFKQFSQYFGGKYMPWWYGAFAVVMLWFLLNMVNNSAVTTYELTAYDSSGKVVGTKTVNGNTMTAPERLPVTKEYRPVKPVKFLN